MTDVNMDDLINKVHCLEFSDMCARLPDKSVDMILCDPPYGTTACNWDTVIPFDTLWTHFKRVIKPRGAIVLTASQPFTSALVMSNLKWFRCEWVWEKTIAHGYMNANKQPLRRHESIIVFYDKQPSYTPQFTKGKPYCTTSGASISHVGDNHLTGFETINDGLRYPTSVIKFNHDGDKYHPTQKPVELFSYLIRTYTQEGELVFDPCVGSGTTALASVNTGRNFICSDFTQEYVDIANARLERADPTKPTRLTDNHTQLSLLGLLND